MSNNSDNHNDNRLKLEWLANVINQFLILITAITGTMDSVDRTLIACQTLRSIARTWADPWNLRQSLKNYRASTSRICIRKTIWHHFWPSNSIVRLATSTSGWPVASGRPTWPTPISAHRKSRAPYCRSICTSSNRRRIHSDQSLIHQFIIALIHQIDHSDQDLMISVQDKKGSNSLWNHVLDHFLSFLLFLVTILGKAHNRR